MRCLGVATTWLLLLHLYIVACFEPVSTFIVTGTIGVLGAVILKKAINSLYYSECCNQPWIQLNDTGLKNDLHARLHGQHLVIPAVLRSVKSHTSDSNPQKPLVLSFHGWTGGGKNFVTRIITDNVFKLKEKSQYVHIFNSEIHFKHSDKINVYKDNLHSWIYHNVSKCERSIFIFDEMDHMPEGMIDVLIPFLGHSVQVDGVDFRKTIFIFLSFDIPPTVTGSTCYKLTALLPTENNPVVVRVQATRGGSARPLTCHENRYVWAWLFVNTGGDLIMKSVLRQWESGKKREAIKLRDMQSILEISAYNQKGGLKKSKLVHRNLIDHFIPFLPLERSHVRSCVIDEFRRLKINRFKENDIADVLDELKWFPDNVNLYSTSGCKKIAQKIALFWV